MVREVAHFALSLQPTHIGRCWVSISKARA